MRIAPIRRHAAAFLVLLACGLTACGSATDNATDAAGPDAPVSEGPAADPASGGTVDEGPARGGPSPAATTTLSAEDEAFLQHRNPYNGLPTEDEEIEGRPPWVMAVEGAGAAEGLERAEIVVEYLLADLSGIAAVAAEQPEDRPAIGPVRDAHLADVAVAASVGGVLTAASAPDDVRTRILELGLPMVALSGEAGSIEGNVKPRPPRWTYESADTAAAEPAGGLAIRGRLDDDGPEIPGPIWQRHPLAPVWTREDLSQKGPLPIVNIIALEVAGNPGDTDWFTGSGAATVLTHGFTGEAEWSRADPHAPLGLTGPDGLAVALQPGSTWIHILPRGGSAELLR